MAGFKFIVCESSGKWAAALRRELPPAVRMLETRSAGEVFSSLHESLRAVVAIELAAGREEVVVGVLTRLVREFPETVQVVLADSAMRPWEPAVREAGAVHFIASTRQAGEVAAIAARVAGEQAQQGAESLEEQIFASLPWSG